MATETQGQWSRDGFREPDPQETSQPVGLHEPTLASVAVKMNWTAWSAGDPDFPNFLDDSGFGQTALPALTADLGFDLAPGFIRSFLRYKGLLQFQVPREQIRCDGGPVPCSTNEPGGADKYPASTQPLEQKLNAVSVPILEVAECA